MNKYLEALECLDKVYSRLPQWDLSRNIDQCNIIKQALLKAQKEHEALEIIKRNLRVQIEYGTERKDISYALVFYIDNKKVIYIVDEAIKEQNPKHFEELELLKEVLE